MAEELAATAEHPVEESELEASSVDDVANLGDLKPKIRLTGKVKRLELYGAFIDIGVGTDAILHISKLGQRVNRVSDLLSVGDEVSVWVESVDLEKQQVTVTMVEPLAVEWRDLRDGQVYTGKVTRLEKYGVFVDIGAEKEGLVHISELSRDYVKHPSEVVKVGEEIEVEVLSFNKRKRRIDLSRKSQLEDSENAVEEDEELEDLAEEEVMPTAMEIALRRAMSEPGDSQSSGESEKRKRAKLSSKRIREQQESILDRTLRLGQDTTE